MKVRRFDSSEGNVWKFVFDFDDAVSEAVLYKYESFTKRTVMCVSVQSGCPVGCLFCGTGKRFIRNLTCDEIMAQVDYLVHEAEQFEGINTSLNARCEKLQIMFMSMGEPMLNMANVVLAIGGLNNKYPNAELLVSTIAPKKAEALDLFLTISTIIPKVGLQFSVHEAFEEKRNTLIPFKNKLNLREMRDYGIEWHKKTGRPVFINYCISENNQSQAEMDRLMDLFSPVVFNFTFSVICSADETMKDKGYRELDKINKITENFLESGYNVRVFNPAGQDDIGGGCGQLWYVQEWMKQKQKS